MLQCIYNQISRADIIVADMSDRNPNVFYETGYAHALGKRTILLTKNVEDIPFDFKHFPHIVYNSIIDLMPELERRLKWNIDHMNDDVTYQSDQIIFYINGNLIEESGIYSVPKALYYDSQCVIDIGVNNESNSPYLSENEKLAVITTSEFGVISSGEISGDKFLSLPDGRRHYEYELSRILLPGAWDELHINIETEITIFNMNIPLTLRHYTSIGPRDLNFYITVLSEDISQDFDF